MKTTLTLVSALVCGFTACGAAVAPEAVSPTCGDELFPPYTRDLQATSGVLAQPDSLLGMTDTELITEAGEGCFSGTTVITTHVRESWRLYCLDSTQPCSFDCIPSLRVFLDDNRVSHFRDRPATAISPTEQRRQ